VAPPYSQSRELLLKLVLYGPGAAGKTSALNYLYGALRPDVRGQLVAVNTGSDRTLFFDFFPPPPARLLGVTIHIQIYTTSGAIQSEATRRSLLAGSDGILFIADSQRGREQDNILALEQMRSCLFDLNLTLDQVPLVMAWNKRDLADALSTGELDAGLNITQVPTFATVAQLGQGIFDAFRAVASRALDAACKRRPELQNGGLRIDIKQTSDVVSSRRILAMQDTQRAMALLRDRYRSDRSSTDDSAAYPESLTSHTPLPTAAPLSSMSAGQGSVPPIHPSAAGLGGPAHGQVGIPVTSSLDGPRESPSRPPGRTPVSHPGPQSAPALSQPPRSEPPRSETDPRSDSGSARRTTMSGQRPSSEALHQSRSSSGRSAPSGSGRESQPGQRSGRFDGAGPSPSRDLWFSHLLPPGSLRVQLQDVERQILSGQWSAGVRRAASLFYALTATEATREPDEGPAWRGLVLGLPVERYLRFRQAVQDAEAGKCSLEDGLFALFFLLDAALRKEAWLTRGA
jgi:GTPase SAR1 family protein